MADTSADSASTSVQQIENLKSGDVASVGKNKVAELPKLPGDPANRNAMDAKAINRATRMQKIIADLAEQSDNERSERILSGNSRRGVEEAVSDEESENAGKAGSVDGIDGDVANSKDELELGAELAEVVNQDTDGEPSEEAEPEQTEEQRKASRRKETEAKAVAEAKEEPAEEPESEPAAAKQKEDASKLDKERREKFEKVLQMEAKAQKQADKVRQREQAVDRREREFEAKAQEFQRQWQARSAQYDRDLKTAQMILDLAKTSPLELLERAGAKPDDVAKWIADASDPVSKMRRDMDARFADLQAREQRLAHEERQRTEKAQFEANRAKVEQTFMSHFEEKDGDDYTFEAARTIYSRGELTRLGNEIADEAYQRGERFTTRDIAEAINEVAKEDDRYRQITARYSSKAAASKEAPEPSTARTEVPAKTATTQATKPAPQQVKPTGVAITNSAVQDVAPKKAAPSRNWKEKRSDRVKRLINGM